MGTDFCCPDSSKTTNWSQKETDLTDKLGARELTGTVASSELRTAEETFSFVFWCVLFSDCEEQFYNVEMFNRADAYHGRSTLCCDPRLTTAQICDP